jgi:hypothetical protein
MAYSRARNPWAPGVAGGTLIRAVDLNHMEDGIVAAAAGVDNLQLQVNDTNTNVASLAADLALVRDAVNKGYSGGSTGGGTGNGTITSVNGYPGPLVILTKTDIGLDQVNNTSDANKPISTATQTALNGKASLDSPTFTGNVTGINKASVGLGNVDNTSDNNKPISTAQAAALAAKANLNSPTFTGTVSGITKSMVGLGSVDNLSAVDSFNNFGVLPKIYYSGTTWPNRNVPTGYTGPVIWNSELYANVASPTGAINNDRWERKRS